MAMDDLYSSGFDCFQQCLPTAEEDQHNVPHAYQSQYELGVQSLLEEKSVASSFSLKTWLQELKTNFSYFSLLNIQ